MNISEITELYDINGPDFVKFLKENKLEYTFSYENGIEIKDNKVGEYINRFAEVFKIKDIKKADNKEMSELMEKRAQLAKEAHDARMAKLLEESEKQLEKERQRISALSEMIVTSCSHLEGYKIVKYSGLISGDDAVSIGRGEVGIFVNGATNVQSSLMSSLSVIRRCALQKLKEEAYKLGCNAVIGIDFDYITLDPETANYNGGTTYLPYVFGVTANGTAVIVEKIEDGD